MPSLSYDHAFNPKPMTPHSGRMAAQNPHGFFAHFQGKSMSSRSNLRNKETSLPETPSQCQRLESGYMPTGTQTHGHVHSSHPPKFLGCTGTWGCGSGEAAGIPTETRVLTPHQESRGSVPGHACSLPTSSYFSTSIKAGEPSQQLPRELCHCSQHPVPASLAIALKCALSKTSGFVNAGNASEED